MNITCPSCFAAYRVPEALARAGTKLRCAACAREWVPEVPADPMPDPTRPPEALTVMEPVEEQAAPPLQQREDTPPLAPDTSEIIQSGTARILGPTAPPALQQRGLPHAGALVRRRRPGNLLPMAWAASLLLVIVAAAGVLIYSAQIATAWPPFARVSGLLGS